MATRNTKTAVTDQTGQNRTATHLSTNIIIKAHGYVVGAIQTFNIQESRDIAMIDELGTDGHIDSAPKNSANFSASCNRVRFDKQRITDAFGCSFIHVHAQRLPFDIEIHDTFVDVNQDNAIVTTLHNCWIKSISYDYGVSDWIISDKMDIVAEAISSIVANNANVVGPVANGQDGTIQLNQYEQEADRGKFRGAIDAPGLITAFTTDPTS